jgi:tetratricopeptide (TPR) repeat protein
MDIVARALDAASRNIAEENFSSAELICDQLERVDPNNPAGIYLSSKCKNGLGKKDQAEMLLDRLGSIQPKESVGHNNFGLSYLLIRENDMAERHFLEAVRLDPKNHSAWSNLGCVFKNRRQIAMAAAAMEISLSMDKQATGLVNLASVYGEMLQMEKARETLEEALDIDPECNSAKMNLSCVMHLTGRWKEAWALYRSRFDQYSNLKEKIEQLPPGRMWDGKKGGKILVFSEQGIGDTFNFVRFAKELEERRSDCEVHVLVPRSIEEFIKRHGFKVTSVAEGFDHHCSMMDLPMLLGMSADDVGNTDFRFKASAKCDLSKYDGSMKVGICWSGNPMHPRDEARCCRLLDFRGIHDIKGVKLFSLQMDARPRVWPSSSAAVDLCAGCEAMRVVNMAPHIRGWEDTASIIESLDLVVSVDTSVLHLAASMGKPTWGLLSYLPDWRWGLGSSKSHWYRSIRLFRQREPFEWRDAFLEIENAIKEGINM